MLSDPQKSVLLLSGALQEDSQDSNLVYLDTTEEIVLDGTNSSSGHCNKSEHVIKGAIGSSGGLIKGRIPFLCGGMRDINITASNDCYVMDNMKPVNFLSKERAYAASVLVNEDRHLWILGCWNRNKYIFKSTEIVSPDDEPIHGPTMPLELVNHCALKLDENTVLVNGGLNSLKPKMAEKRTFEYSFHHGKWSQGPSLNQVHWGHVCGTIVNTADGYKTHLVIGGVDSQTVELMNRKPETETKWIVVKEQQPRKISYPMGVAIDKTFYLFGGRQDLDPIIGATNESWSMECFGTNCTWSQLDHVIMRTPRHGGLALAIPESLSGCDFL